MNKKITILGAGISGLTTAYLLQKKGFDVAVIEKNNRPGGAMESVHEQGFLFDRGPNSLLETVPLIGQLVGELGLEPEVIYANEEGNKRYILRNNQLHALPTSLKAFLQTKLFSTAAKFRLLKEPFVGRSDDGYYQSIAEFVKRRLGQEFLDYAINPFVAGVYAGRPEKLSVASAFPKLYALEEKYGGLMIGAFKSAKERKKRAEVSKQSAKMLSFKNGMQTLPLALAKHLGNRVLTDSEIISVEKSADEKFIVTYIADGKKSTIVSDAVLSTIPPYGINKLLSNFDANIDVVFSKIEYPPVLVCYLVYPKNVIGQPLDGFGFLIPEKEKKSFLGAVWSSVIFTDRSDEKHAAFTLFVGGMRNPEIIDEDREKLVARVQDEFEQIMKISGEPFYKSTRFWAKAIPQYNLGYIETENYFDAFEANNPGIFLGGNYRGGVSVGDCIKNAEPTAEKIEKYFDDAMI
jgi:oxygen-dependent protoporphyrinogen oxidase